MPREGRDLTVLLVDDEEFHLQFIESLLIRGGHRVHAAHSGPEALSFLDSHPDEHLDIALIDVVMPGMDGVALANEMFNRRPNLPVLFMSAYSGNPELRPVFTRDLPFIAKPISTPALNKAFSALLNKDLTVSE
jgi:CheY-like chemotaxis protein